MDVVGWSGEIFKCSKVVVEGFALFYLSEQIKGEIQKKEDRFPYEYQ